MSDDTKLQARLPNSEPEVQAWWASIPRGKRSAMLIDTVKAGMANRVYVPDEEYGVSVIRAEFDSLRGQLEVAFTQLQTLISQLQVAGVAVQAAAPPKETATAVTDERLQAFLDDDEELWD